MSENVLSRIVLLVVFAFVLSTVSDARAQQCDVIPEMVTKLYHPDIATYTVWDEDFGEGQKSEYFKTAMKHGEGVLAVGEMVRMQGVGPVLMMAKFDRRGRRQWSRFHSLSGLSEVVKVIPYGKVSSSDHFLVLANIRKETERAYFWLGFFDAEGKLLAQRQVKDKRFNLRAHDIQLKIESSGFLVPVSSSVEIGDGRLKTIRQNAVIYDLDLQGKERSSRAFTLGDNNQISSISVSKKEGVSNGYIATGWFENSFGKKKGWLLRLNPDVSMIWQKEMGRGKSAILTNAITDKNGHYVVLGHITSPQDQGGATWLMSVNPVDGQLSWQRYYYSESGQHDYFPVGAVARGDGVITLAMNASFRKGRKKFAVLDDENVRKVIDDDLDYVHFLNINPRGVTLSGDSYLSGKGVAAHQMSDLSEGRLLLTGQTLVPKIDVVKDVAREKHMYDKPLREGDVFQLSEDNNVSDGVRDLQKKIAGQVHEAEDGNESAAKDDSAKLVELTQNAWVSVVDSSSEYKDPCLNIYIQDK